jgi:hypothetical protein
LTDVARLVFLGLVGAWAGAVALAILRVRVLVRRRGRGAAWPAVRTLLPLADLVGTWAGALAAAALLWGRVGFGAAWAAALGLVALMATASLYDRAVLLPSLDAAFKRLPADPRWEDEWRFLWRMGAWGRGVTLAMAVGAAACACVA